MSSEKAELVKRSQSVCNMRRHIARWMTVYSHRWENKDRVEGLDMKYLPKAKLKHFSLKSLFDQELLFAL